MRSRSMGFWGWCLWLATGTAFAQTTPIPERDGWIIDQTEILSQATVDKVEKTLSEHAKDTDSDVAVLLVPNTGEETPEQYGLRVIENWGLGGDDQRAVVLVWSADGFIGMGVGKGLASVLTADIQSQIERAWIIPRFGNGDADGGIAEGAEHIIRVIAGQQVTDDDDAAASAEAATLLAGGSEQPQPAPEEEQAPPSPTEEEAIEEPSEPHPLQVELDREASRIVAGFDEDPRRMLGTLSQEASQQLSTLPAALGLGAADKTEDLAGLPGYAQTARLVLAGLAIVAVMALLARSPRFAALVLGVPGAAALWVATGFTALSLFLLAAAIVFIFAWPILKPILGALLSRNQGDDADADDERRKREAIAAATSKRPVPLNTRRAGVSVTLPPVAGATATPSSPPPDSRSNLTAAERTQLRAWPDLDRMVRKAEQLAPKLERLQMWHILVATVVLFFVFAPFAILGIVAALAFQGAKSRGVPVSTSAMTFVSTIARSAMRAREQTRKGRRQG